MRSLFLAALLLLGALPGSALRAEGWPTTDWVIECEEETDFCEHYSELFERARLDLIASSEWLEEIGFKASRHHPLSVRSP